MRKHGHASRVHGNSPTYETWRGMVDRCKPTGAYGRRGITVCARWRSFDAFLADMGERPAGHELDRIDATKGYLRGNCRWLDERTNRQLRSTVKLTPSVRAKIDRMRAEGMSQRAIADAIGCSKSVVWKYLAGVSWRPQNVEIPRPPSWMVA